MPKGTPLQKGNKAASLHVRLTQEQYEFLWQYTYKRGMNMSEYMRSIIERLMAIEKFEGFKEAEK